MNKIILKKDLIDLRMKLAEAENQALKIPRQIPLAGKANWKLIFGVYKNIQSADDKLCKLVKLLGLVKLDIVKDEIKEKSNE